MFNDWLLKKLREMDWKQADLARRSGITTGSISNYMNGRTPDREALTKISKAFKVPLEEVFRAAELIPPDLEIDILTKEAVFIFQRLSQEEKENAIRHLRLHLKIQEERKKSKGKNNEP